MGNQPMQPGTADSVTHSIFSTPGGKFLGVRWEGLAHAQGWKPDVFCRFIKTPMGDDKDIVSLAVPGGADDQPNRYLVLSGNGNVVGGNEPFPWLIESTGRKGMMDGSEIPDDLPPASPEWPLRAGEYEEVSIRVPPLGRCDSYRGDPAFAGDYIRREDKGLLRRASECDRKCLFLHSLDTLPEKKLKNARKVAKGIASLIKLSPGTDHPPSMATEADIAAYKRDGFVVIRNLLSPGLIRDAKKKISEGMEQGKDRSKGILGIGAGLQKWSKEYARAEEVMYLFSHSPAMRTCEALSGNICSMPKEGQIALRKKTEDGSKDFGVGFDWHIDAYDKWTAARFGILAVVALSDWDADNMGNFTVYRGTHHKVAQMMKEMTWMEWNKAVTSSADLGVPPEQVHVKAGDVIFAHPLLAHDVAPNLTDHVRWAVIFRSNFIDMHGRRKELLSPEQVSEEDMEAALGPPPAYPGPN